MQARQKTLGFGAFNQQIYRLRKNGIIRTEKGIVCINKEKLVRFSAQKNSIIKSNLVNKTQKILISFDIPESKRKTRDWLRNQIKFWDFEMIHKSLWLGYGPLPQEFNDRLKHLGINGNVRVFKLVKGK